MRHPLVQPGADLQACRFSEHADCLIVISYDSLATQRQSTINRLYRELGETPFEHDFDHIDYDEPEFDLQIGIPELHKVRPKGEFRKHESCLRPDLVAKYAETNFWLKSALNNGRVTVI